jgi:hypothetical protein
MLNSFLAKEILEIYVEPCFSHIVLSIKFEHQFITRIEAKNESC